MAVGVNSIMELTFMGTVNSQKVLTILHFACTNQPTQNDAIVVQDDFLQEVIGGGGSPMEVHYTGCCGSNYLLNSLRAQIVSPTRYRPSYLTRNLSGTRTGACTAQNVSGVITKQTDLSGRKQVGSVHIPGISASDYTSGKMTSGWLSDAVLFGNDLLQNVIENGGQGVWAPCLYHVGQQGQNAWNRLTAYLVQDTLRTMRRRTVGLGI